VCVAYLRQKSTVNFRPTKVNAGKLKRKYLNRPRSTLAVNALIRSEILCLYKCTMSAKNITRRCEKAYDKDKPCGNLNKVTLNPDSHFVWESLIQGCTNFPKI
jgi:hypothetical protein